MLLRIRLTGAVLFDEDIVEVGRFNGGVLGEDVVHGLDQSESLIMGGLEGQERRCRGETCLCSSWVWWVANVQRPLEIRRRTKRRREWRRGITVQESRVERKKKTGGNKIHRYDSKSQRKTKKGTVSFLLEI